MGTCVRFPREIISYAIWFYYRFKVSFRDVEDAMASRGVLVITNRSGAGVKSSGTCTRQGYGDAVPGPATNGISMRSFSGFVNLRRTCDGMMTIWRDRSGTMHSGSGEGRRPGHFIPNPEAFATECSVISSREQVASGAEVRRNDTVNLDKALGVSRGLEPSHAPLPLTRRLMRVLRPVVQVPMLAVRDAGHHHS